MDRGAGRGPVGGEPVLRRDILAGQDSVAGAQHGDGIGVCRHKRAGDLQKAAFWEARAASIWDEIEQSARVFVDYIQTEARFVRTGHHGRRVEGVEQGRFEDSR